MGRSGNRGRGATISPAAIVVGAAATDGVAQLRSTLKGPLTWSKLSGTGAVALSSSGLLSLNAALGNGGNAGAIVRVANTSGDAAERAIVLSGSGQASPAPIPSPTTDATTLPQLGALIAQWSADTIAAQTDNSALTSWTDSISGLAAVQGTASAQPRYRTGGAGGKPFVLFSGAQWLDAGSSNAVATACQNAANLGNTAIVVYRGAQVTSFGFLFTASASTGYNLFDNGTQAGFFGQTLQRVGFTGTALTTLCYTADLPVPGTSRLFINGTCVGHQGSTRSAAGASVAIGGSPANAAVATKAEIYEVLVWNRPLTAAEVMQAEKWVRDKYAGGVYPWVGAPFRVFHGDSLTMGANASGPLAAYPARVAAMNGWKFGQWTNLGQVGISMTGMKAQALADVDPMVALLGGTPMHLAAWEWFNQRGQPLATALSETKTYFQARRAAGVARLVMPSSIDASDTAETTAERQRRADFNADLTATWASYADRFVPIHADAAIGVEGACPASPPYTPYFSSDGIHLLDAGYNVLAGSLASSMA